MLVYQRGRLLGGLIPGAEVFELLVGTCRTFGAGAMQFDAWPVEGAKLFMAVNKSCLTL